MRISSMFFRKVRAGTRHVLLQVAARATGAAPGSFEFYRLESALSSLASLITRSFSLIRAEKDRRLNEAYVMRKYDRRAGSYIRDLKENKTAFYIVDHEPKYTTLNEVRNSLIPEMASCISTYEPKSLLEMGAGELTTLSGIAMHMEIDVEFHAVELSLNRIIHGRAFFQESTGRNVNVVTATGVALPYPDSSIDVVFTSFCLEHMPYDFEAAISEMCRVARKAVVLFEPSYEEGDWVQRIRILSTGYVRGIQAYINTLPHRSDPPRLLKSASGPFNRGAVYSISIQRDEKLINEFRLVDPLSGRDLILSPGGLYREMEGPGFYFSYEGIPVILPKNRFIATDIDRSNWPSAES